MTDIMELESNTITELSLSDMQDVSGGGYYEGDGGFNFCIRGIDLGFIDIDLQFGFC